MESIFLENSFSCNSEIKEALARSVTNRKGFWLKPKAEIMLLNVIDSIMRLKLHLQPRFSVFEGGDGLFPKTDKKVCG